MSNTRIVFLQVIGLSSVISAALVIPFLITSAVSSTITSHVASKYGQVRPLFMSSLVILPIGMVRLCITLCIFSNFTRLQGMMSTLDQTSSLGRIVGFSLICGVGFGSVSRLQIFITVLNFFYLRELKSPWSYRKLVSRRIFFPPSLLSLGLFPPLAA